MKALHPQGQVVALIHDEGDREPAEKYGVDIVLTTGMRAAKLKKTITAIAASLSNEEMGSTED